MIWLSLKILDLTLRRQLPDIVLNMRLRYCDIFIGSSKEHPMISTIKIFSKY